MIRHFERVVVVALVAMMVVVVMISTIDLAWLIVRDIVTPPVLLLDATELLDIFGFFLLILIGLELVETIQAYLRDNVVHLRVVLVVAVIAVARKVIVLDLKELEGSQVLGLAALIAALAGAFFLERRAPRVPSQPDDSGHESPPTQTGTSAGTDASPP